MLSDQNLCERLVFAISATCLTHLVSFYMFILLMRDGQYNIQSFPVRNSLSPHAPSSLESNYSRHQFVF